MVQVLNHCFLPSDVITGCHDFSINVEVNGEKQTSFPKSLILQGYTYKNTLKLHKAQDVDKIYTPTIG